MKWLCILVFSFTSLYCNESTVILVTPVRCGTHWMMYSIGTLTGRFVSFWHRFDSDKKLVVPEKTFFGAVKIDQSKAPILHSHYPYCHLGNHTHKGHRLLMVIRNHKEYLLRRSKKRGIDPAIGLKTLSNPRAINQYMEYFRFFESWEEDKRLMVFYEDLIADYETTMKKVLAFIGEGDQHLPEFIAKKKDHDACIFKYYDRVFRRGGGAIGKGKNPLYHSKDVPLDTLRQVDDYIKNKHTQYWEKYLMRYAS